MHISYVCILLTLVFANGSYSQPSCDDTGIPGLTTVFPGYARQMAGTFIVDCGFTGAVYNLDVSGKYDNYEYSCDGKEPTDSGTWKLEGNQISLCGMWPLKYLDIFQFGNYYNWCLMIVKKISLLN